MTTKSHKFSASLMYTFSRHHLHKCSNCGKSPAEHAESKCLFESSFYRQEDLLTFFEHLLRYGGVLSINAGKYTLTQKVGMTGLALRDTSTIGDIRSAGEAVLKEKISAKERKKLLGDPSGGRKES